MTRTRRAFSPAEDTALQARWLAGDEPAQIMEAVPDRLWTTLCGRAEVLGLPRRDFRHRRASYSYPQHRAAPSIGLDAWGLGAKDAIYVAKCIAAGGFPVQVWIDGKTYLVAPDLESAA